MRSHFIRLFQDWIEALFVNAIKFVKKSFEILLSRNWWHKSMVSSYGLKSFGAFVQRICAWYLEAKNKSFFSRSISSSRKVTRDFRVSKKLNFRACCRSRKNTTTVKWGKPLFTSAGQSSINEKHWSTFFWKSIYFVTCFEKVVVCSLIFSAFITPTTFLKS